MNDQKPNHNSRLDEDSLHRIELIANRFGITRTEVVRQAAAILNATVEIATRDDVVGLSALRAQYGDDAHLVISLAERAEGKPVARLSIDEAAPPEGVHALAVLSEAKNKVYVYLGFPREDRTPLSVRLGDELLLVMEARLPIGNTSWPLDPRRKTLAIRLGDLDQSLVEAPVDVSQRTGGEAFHPAGARPQTSRPS
jgi:hypothetical protein